MKTIGLVFGIAILSLVAFEATSSAQSTATYAPERGFAAQKAVVASTQMVSLKGASSEDEEPEPVEASAETVPDPLEPLNRAFFEFNDKLYFWMLKPVATGYKTVVPEEVRVCTRNFFHNLAFPVRFVNNLLQGKFFGAFEETCGFLVNSTVGLGGLSPQRSTSKGMTKTWVRLWLSRVQDLAFISIGLSSDPPHCVTPLGCQEIFFSILLLTWANIGTRPAQGGSTW
jgi:hypothetical protein